MSLHETEALVLKSYPLAEADKIVVFLTRSHGIVRGVAKGAKRLTSRFGGSLEPFSIVRLEFFQSGERELVTIKQVDIIESLFRHASDPSLLAELAAIPDILTGFSPPADPDDRLYRMTRGVVSQAMADGATADALIVYFEFWVLQLGGFMPSWSACSHCGREFDETEDASLRSDFRLSCGVCERVRQQSSVSAGIRSAYRAARTMPPEQFAAYGAENETDVLVLRGFLRQMIAMLLGREAGARA